MKKNTPKAKKASVKVKDLKPKKNPKGGTVGNTVGARSK
jgi:hypothetical protein